MRCVACDAEMRVVGIAPDHIMMVPGYERHTWQCAECSGQEQRLVFARDEGSAMAASPTTPPVGDSRLPQAPTLSVASRCDADADECASLLRRAIEMVRIPHGSQPLRGLTDGRPEVPPAAGAAVPAYQAHHRHRWLLQRLAPSTNPNCSSSARSRWFEVRAPRSQPNIDIPDDRARPLVEDVGSGPVQSVPDDDSDLDEIETLLERAIAMVRIRRWSEIRQLPLDPQTAAPAVSKRRNALLPSIRTRRRTASLQRTPGRGSECCATRTVSACVPCANVWDGR